jgi:hypothetical protein
VEILESVAIQKTLHNWEKPLSGSRSSRGGGWQVTGGSFINDCGQFLDGCSRGRRQVWSWELRRGFEGASGGVCREQAYSQIDRQRSGSVILRSGGGLKSSLKRFVLDPLFSSCIDRLEFGDALQEDAFQRRSVCCST